jgi:hypothetical protein
MEGRGEKLFLDTTKGGIVRTAIFIFSTTSSLVGSKGYSLIIVGVSESVRE